MSISHGKSWWLERMCQSLGIRQKQRLKSGLATAIEFKKSTPVCKVTNDSNRRNAWPVLAFLKAVPLVNFLVKFYVLE